MRCMYLLLLVIVLKKINYILIVISHFDQIYLNDILRNNNILKGLEFYLNLLLH